MKININQQSFSLQTGDTLTSVLTQYCQEHQISLNAIAVSYHNQLVPRSTWNDWLLSDGQTFNLFTAVAGG